MKVTLFGRFCGLENGWSRFGGSSETKPVAKKSQSAALSEPMSEDFEVELHLETPEWLNIFDISRNGLVAVNLEGSVVFLNKTAARIIGISAKEALGRKINELIPRYPDYWK